MRTKKVWDEFSQLLYAFILKKVKSEYDAQDILQDVFIKIHKNIDTLKNPNKLKSWVYSVTHNAIMDYFRTKSFESLPEEIEDNELESEKTLCLECLTPFMNKLEPIYKEALKSTLLESKSQKQFAAEKDIAYTTVKSRVQRGKKLLLELFTDCCSLQDIKTASDRSESEECSC